MAKIVGKLDENVYRPWGPSSNPNSRSNSRANSDAGSELDENVCKGGPGRETCGEQVEDGVQCDKCSSWFHTVCQKIPKPAVTALKKYEVLSWLCDKCKLTIAIGSSRSESATKVEKQIDVLEKVIRDHIKLVEPQLITQSDFHSLESQSSKP